MVRCCVLRVGSCVGWLGGWVSRWCLEVGWLGWVFGGVLGGRVVVGASGVLSVGIGVGVFLKAFFLVWARTTLKAAKCDQHCTVESMLLFRLILASMFSCLGSNNDEGDSELR